MERTFLYYIAIYLSRNKKHNQTDKIQHIFETNHYSTDPLDRQRTIGIECVCAVCIRGKTESMEIRMFECETLIRVRLRRVVSMIWIGVQCNSTGSAHTHNHRHNTFEQSSTWAHSRCRLFFPRHEAIVLMKVCSSTEVILLPFKRRERQSLAGMCTHLDANMNVNVRVVYACGDTVGLCS